MDQMFDELLGQLTQGKGLEALARQVGASEDATAEAAGAALPMMFSALSRNMSAPQGADALLAALDGGHDGSILDDLVGALGGGGAEGSSIGEAILGHMLGVKRGGIESEIGRSAGLDGATISKLLVALAPLVMGALGKAQQEHRMGSQELGYELGQVAKHAEDSLGARFGPLGNLLDMDGDGQIDEGIISAGKSLLGRFFRR
ncbi:MAG: DUF937 domain-containing protein [Deltaproteobacteria bacterium]|nr:DUF937 domain-containing protein [Deltaproteobacteria bacterium]MBW2394372.1 DUF937 domain-containing protein [Deltaproteobacteria bacterium]